MLFEALVLKTTYIRPAPYLQRYRFVGNSPDQVKFRLCTVPTLYMPLHELLILIYFEY